MFTIREVAEMLDMSSKEVKEEIESGHLNYSFQEGEKKITLYDLEKYMGAERTSEITSEYLSSKSNGE